MRLTTAILIASIMQVSAVGFGQKITLKKSNASLEEVIRDLRQQSGYDFVTTDDLLDQSKRVTIAVQNTELKQVLDKIFKYQPITYYIENNTVTLQIREKGFIEQLVDRFQAINIRGIVADPNGTPLSGAVIKVLGTNLAASTDRNGSFSIDNVDENATIVITYIGYETKKMLPAKDMGTIYLKLAVQKLDEVVMVGYGTSTKRLNSGTVSSITSDDIANQPVSNVLSALAGRISGMSVSQNNGLPGSSYDIQIRSRNSLISQTTPLYVIDGIPFSNDPLNAGGLNAANGSISPFATINPADIERIDVLKDAASTSIYGARGANGVVLITTKRGKIGPATLNVNAYRGAGKVSHYIPMLNTQEYLELRREAFRNDGVTPDETNAPDLTVYDQNAYTDWQKALLGSTANVTDLQASFSGGEQKLRYMINGNYRKEGTVFGHDLGNQRIGGRINLDYGGIGSKFNAKFSVGYSTDKTNLVQTDLTTAYNLPPNYNAYNEDGTLFWDDYQTNPYAYLQQKYLGNNNTLISNSNLSYAPVLGLSFKINLGYTRSNLDQKTAQPASSSNPAYNFPSYGYYGTSTSTNFIAEPTVNYELFKNRSKFSVLGGMSWQKNNNEGFSIRGENFSSDEQLFSVSSAGVITSENRNFSKYNFMSMFGKVNYTLDSKYIFDASYRRDGSSKFGANRRFGNFGSIAAAWLFSQEQFIKDAVPFLSFGKLRSSYGNTGNDQINNYLYLPLYTGIGIYDSRPTLRLQTPENPNIHWESTKKFELGLDLGFLNDRLLLTTNYYVDKSSNQLITTRLPSQAGFFVFVENLDALIKNTGVEFELNAKLINSDKFKWSANANVTFMKSRLVKFPGIESGLYSNQYTLGEPPTLTKLYQFNGVDATTGAATYQDLDGDGMDDYLPSKIGTPFYGGINNTFTYKSWSLDFLIQFNHRMGQNNLISQYQGEGVLGFMSNQNTSVSDRWRNPGDTGKKFPGATATAYTDIYSGYSQYQYSTAQYGDNSFLRFKSVNLSYGLPENWVKSMKMKGVSVYLQGQNLYTLTKNKYVFDPETSGVGIGTMPLLRTIVLGINCTL